MRVWCACACVHVVVMRSAHSSNAALQSMGAAFEVLKYDPLKTSERPRSREYQIAEGTAEGRRAACGTWCGEGAH